MRTQQVQLRNGRTPALVPPTFARVRPGLLQRACACGGTPGVDGECAECRRKRLGLQPKTTKQAAPVVHEALNSPGRPLDANTRAFMEPRFGHNFGQVRVHADEKAAESARAVGALAYTVGTEVVFGAGHYAPETTEGRRLLSHELAHVVQQAGSPGPIDMMWATVMSAEDDPLEREAQGAAARIDASQNVSISSGHPAPGLQRQAGPDPTDDCSGWEQDPESFSIHVARFVARTQINPILGRDIPSVDCVDSRECRVTLSNGLTITVMWNPTSRKTLAKWETEQEYKRYLYDYSCPGGQLTLKFVLSRNTGKTPPSASGEQEGP